MYIRPWLIGKSETETRLERLEASIMQLQTSVANSSAAMAETLKAIQESLALQRDRSVQVRSLLLAVCLCTGQILFHIYMSKNMHGKQNKNMSKKGR